MEKREMASSTNSRILQLYLRLQRSQAVVLSRCISEFCRSQFWVARKWEVGRQSGDRLGRRVFGKPGRDAVFSTTTC
jgi:hypothetical protein